MKIALFFYFLIFVNLFHSQTQTPKLSDLIKRVDSLSNLLRLERQENQEQLSILKQKLSEVEKQRDLLEKELGIDKSLANSYKSEVNEKSFDLVSIGKQTWMKKNLNVAFFRNGESIPEAKTKEEWISAGKQGKPAWCHYDNDPKNDEKFGKLYNWYAVSDPRGLAPLGLKIPEFEDLNLLDTYLWGDVGLKLKNDTGWSSWNVEERCKACIGWTEDQKRAKKCGSCNNKGVRISKTNSGNGTNSSGFSALPGGFRNSNGEFEKMGQQCFLWSSSPQFTMYGRYRILSNMDDELIMNYATKDLGMSVRCLKE